MNFYCYYYNYLYYSIFIMTYQLRFYLQILILRQIVIVFLQHCYFYYYFYFLYYYSLIQYLKVSCLSILIIFMNCYQSVVFIIKMNHLSYCKNFFYLKMLQMFKVYYILNGNPLPSLDLKSSYQKSFYLIFINSTIFSYLNS